MNYYYAANSTRRIKSGRFTFQFEPCSIAGGVWAGTYATENPQEVEALSTVEGIEKISKERYDELLKKKPKIETLRGFTSSVAVRGTLADLASPAEKGKADKAVTVDAPKVETLESLIKTAPVAPADMTTITPRGKKT